MELTDLIFEIIDSNGKLVGYSIHIPGEEEVKLFSIDEVRGYRMAVTTCEILLKQQLGRLEGNIPPKRLEFDN